MCIFTFFSGLTYQYRNESLAFILQNIFTAFSLTIFSLFIFLLNSLFCLFDDLQTQRIFRLYRKELEKESFAPNVLKFPIHIFLQELALFCINENLTFIQGVALLLQDMILLLKSLKGCYFYFPKHWHPLNNLILLNYINFSAFFQHFQLSLGPSCK